MAKKKYFFFVSYKRLKQVLIIYLYQRMSSRLQLKIKNQKVYLDISQGKQKLFWTLENRFDQRKYTAMFPFPPQQTDKLINFTRQKKFQIKIKYQTSEIVTLDVVKFGTFTLNIDRSGQQKMDIEDEESDEPEIMNAFSVEEEESEKMDKLTKGKVLHQQYDDLNPSNYINFSNVFPYNAQVSIRVTYQVNGELKRAYGSGCLISPIIVLTCAHIIFSIKYRVYCTSIEVKPYGKPATSVVQYRLPKEFPEKVIKQESDDSEYDYAILILKDYYTMKPLSLLANFQEKVIAEIPGHPVSKQKVNAPAKNKHKVPITKNTEDIPDYNINFYGLKNARNLLEKFKEDLIPHKISTARGQSGSPVIVELQKSNYFVIGIHVADDQDNEQNLAVRLSSRILKQILGWCSQVPVPNSPYNFIKTVMPIVVDYKSLAPVSPQNYGFSLRDVEKHLDNFKQIGKMREQKCDFRKAAKYYGKVKQFKQEYKNDNIQTKIVEMNIKYAAVYRLYQKQYKQKIAKQYQHNKVKIPKNKQLIYFQKAKEALRECEQQAALVLVYVEYFQLFCEVMKRLIQFDEEGNKYGKHKVFEGLLANLEEEEDQSIKKYARSKQATQEIISLFNSLKYQCYLKLGQSYSDENKRKFRKAYEAFKKAELALQRVKEPSPSMFIEVQHKIFSICTYQTHKLSNQFQEEAVLTVAIQYASKIAQNCRKINNNNNENKILEQIIEEVSSGIFIIMKYQLPKEDLPRISKYVDIILEKPAIILRASSKQQVMSRFKFL